ncbi:SGNH hydrolase domain-containing protein, partial [Photobacterium sp. OFAV2-7]|uniref:SGNH hydrolase domain-containing protein n=1 Tax=Photobacterium sp. OFAV2-7 TaxID=2917748 RepID=UPI00272A08A6
FRSYVDELGKEFGFSSLYGGLGGCPPLLSSDLIKHGEPEMPCSERNDQLAMEIKESDVSVVFLAGRWAMYTETTRAEGEKGSRVFVGDSSDYSENKENSRRALKEGLERTIAFLIENDITPVLFEQAPSYSFKPSNCWVKKASYPWLENTYCDLEEQDMELRQGFANNLIKEVTDKFPEVILIPVVDTLCQNGKCSSKLNGIPLYSDNNHLNSEGAREIYRTSMSDGKLQVLIDRLKTL